MKLSNSKMESGRDETLIYAYTYWAPLLYVLGLMGSVASLITLQSSKFSARIYVYLKSLALADLGFLVFAISFCTRMLEKAKEFPNVYDESEYSVAVYHLSELPIINGFLSASVFIVVCMTMDRYFAICQPTEYQRSKKTLNPRIEVMLAFSLGFILQIPQFVAYRVVHTYCKILWFNTTEINLMLITPVSTETTNDCQQDCSQLNCYCLTESDYYVFEEHNAAVTFIEGRTICSHLYEKIQLPGLDKSILWMGYKVCCEILVRLGPTVLLIGTNVAIIRKLNLSIHRKKKLRATKFVERTASQLFPKRTSSFFEAQTSKATGENKIDSFEHAADSIFAIKTLEENNQISIDDCEKHKPRNTLEHDDFNEKLVKMNRKNSSSFSFPPRRSSSTIDSSGLVEIYLTTGATNDITGGDKFRDVFRSRRMSLAVKSKQKKIVSILVAITVMFTIVNIPSAICRIMIDENVQDDWFRKFQVAANMLELCNASINFYMYCICNKDIRSHFWKILVSACHKWKNNSKESDGGVLENSTFTKHRNCSISSDFFHRLRRNSLLLFSWSKGSDKKF